MLREIWLIAMFGLLGSAVLAHSPGVKDEDQAAAHEVEGFREFVKRAVDRRDGGALRALYAEGYTHTDETGRVDGKDARIVAVMAGEPVIENAPADDLLFRVFGEHTIVVTGKSAISDKARQPGQQLRWLVVYVKVGADWKIAASQATRLP